MQECVQPESMSAVVVRGSFESIVWSCTFFSNERLKGTVRFSEADNISRKESRSRNNTFSVGTAVEEGAHSFSDLNLLTLSFFQFPYLQVLIDPLVE